MEKAARFDEVRMKGVRIDRVADLGLFSTIREKRVFVPLLLIGSPRPIPEPGGVVALSLPRWFTLEHDIAEWETSS
jgi:hypothetical protein